MLNKLPGFICVYGLVILASTCLLISCKQNQGDKPKSEAETIEEIKQTLNQYYQDIKTKGLLAELDYLDNSQDFYWVPPGYTSALSYDSVKTIIKGNASLFKQVNNQISNLKVDLLDDTHACYWAIINSEMTDKADSLKNYKLIETGTLIKRESGWKLLNGHTSMINQ